MSFNLYSITKANLLIPSYAFMVKIVLCAFIVMKGMNNFELFSVSLKKVLAFNYRWRDYQ